MKPGHTHSPQYGILAELPVVRETLQALSTLAGMAVMLAPADPWPDERWVARGITPLCRSMLHDRKGAAACHQFLTGLQSQFKCGMWSVACGTSPWPRPAPGAKPRPVRALCAPHSALRAQQCFAGLTELAAPVVIHGQHMATLCCGQFFPRKPTERDFERCWSRLQQMGIAMDIATARKAYFHTPVATPARIHAAGQLLAALARHLGEVAAHCLSAPHRHDPACVACAKQLVAKNLKAIPSTCSAAREAHVTEPYFCRRFKAATGITFSEYVARCHVDLACKLLQNPSFRVTDVADAAGFNSIPHFNHTFKRYTGLSPNGYRASLRKA